MTEQNPYGFVPFHAGMGQQSQQMPMMANVPYGQMVFGPRPGMTMPAPVMYPQNFISMQQPNNCDNQKQQSQQQPQPQQMMPMMTHQGIMSPIQPSPSMPNMVMTPQGYMPMQPMPAMSMAPQGQQTQAQGEVSNPRPQSPPQTVPQGQTMPGMQPMMPVMYPMGYYPQPSMMPQQQANTDANGIQSPQQAMYPTMFFGWPGPCGPVMFPTPSIGAPSVCSFPGENADYQHVQVDAAQELNERVETDFPDEVTNDPQSAPIPVDTQPCQTDRIAGPMLPAPIPDPVLKTNELVVESEPTYMNQRERAMSEQPCYANQDDTLPMYANQEELGIEPPKRNSRGLSMPPWLDEEVIAPKPPPRSRAGSRQSLLSRSTHSLHALAAGIEERLKEFRDNVKSQHPTHSDKKSNPRRPPRRKDKERRAAFATLPRNFKSKGLDSIMENAQNNAQEENDDQNIEAKGKLIIPMPGTDGLNKKQENRSNTPEIKVELSPTTPVVAMPGSPESSVTMSCTSPAVPMPGTYPCSPTSTDTPLILSPSPMAMAPTRPAVPMPGTSSDQPIVSSIINDMPISSVLAVPEPLSKAPVASVQIPIIITSPVPPEELKGPSPSSGVIVLDKEEAPYVKKKHEYEEIEFENDKQKNSSSEEEFEPISTPPAEKKSRENSGTSSESKKKSRFHEYDDVEMSSSSSKEKSNKKTLIVEVMPRPPKDDSLQDLLKVVEAVQKETETAQDESNNTDPIIPTVLCEPIEKVIVCSNNDKIQLPSPAGSGRSKTPSDKENSIMETSNQILEGLREMDSKIQNLKVGIVKVYEDVYSKHVYALPNKAKKCKSLSELAVLQNKDDDYEELDVITKGVVQIDVGNNQIAIKEPNVEGRFNSKKEEAPKYENAEVLADMWREVKEAGTREKLDNINDDMLNYENDHVKVLESPNYENGNVALNSKADNIENNELPNYEKENIDELQEEDLPNYENDVVHTDDKIPSYENEVVPEVHLKPTTNSAKEKSLEAHLDRISPEPESQPEMTQEEIDNARKEISKHFRQTFFGIQQDNEDDEEEETSNNTSSSSTSTQENNNGADPDLAKDKTDDQDQNSEDDPGTETLDVTIDLPITSPNAMTEDGAELDQGPSADEEDKETIGDRDSIGRVEDQDGLEEESFDWNAIAVDDQGNLLSVTLQEKLKYAVFVLLICTLLTPIINLVPGH